MVSRRGSRGSRGTPWFLCFLCSPCVNFSVSLRTKRVGCAERRRGVTESRQRTGGADTAGRETTVAHGSRRRATHIQAVPGEAMIQLSRRLFGAGMALGAAALAACDSGTGSSDDLFAPTGLAVTAASPTSVTITFNAVPGATGYEVQRAPGTGADFATVGTTASSPFTDSGLDPAATYNYRVAAMRGAEKSDFTAGQAVTLLNRPVATISTDITANRRLDSDTVYLLGAFVHVGNGATLTIEEGTRI